MSAIKSTAVLIAQCAVLLTAIVATPGFAAMECIDLTPREGESVRSARFTLEANGGTDVQSGFIRARQRAPFPLERFNQLFEPVTPQPTSPAVNAQRCFNVSGEVGSYRELTVALRQVGVLSNRPAFMVSVNRSNRGLIFRDVVFGEGLNQYVVSVNNVMPYRAAPPQPHIQPAPDAQERERLSRSHFDTVEVIVTVTRPERRCTMFAHLTGDVTGTFFGGTAFFNLLSEGKGVQAGMAGGTMADEEAHEQLQNFGAFIEQMAGLAEQQGHALPEDVKEKLQRRNGGSSAMRDDMREWQTEIFSSGNDNFGLTLVDTKSVVNDLLGADPNAEWDEKSTIEKSLVHAEGLHVYGDTTGDDGVYAVGVLGKYFTATLSGQLVQETSGDGATFSRLATLSELRVSPRVADAEGTKVQFVLDPESGGQATVELMSTVEGMLAGRIVAQMFTDKHYDGERREIMMAANFTAMRGPTSCAP